MVNYKDSEIVQILPENIKNFPEVIALSYAISKAIKKLVDCTENISVYAAVDELPEKMLNLLAVELRAQYYDEKLSIEQKRTIVKSALLWHEHAGTPYAVEEMIKAVFGTGEVKEWFEYGGKPYYFRVETDTTITEESTRNFQNIMRRVKNTRSHMEAISVTRRSDENVYSAGVIKQTLRPVAIKEEAV